MGGWAVEVEEVVEGEEGEQVRWPKWAYRKGNLE